ARLIDDLLDLTRIARCKLQFVQSGPVDVHSLLFHTHQIVGSDARQKSIHLQFALVASEHHVGCDAARLHQVFWNLIKNAIKFTCGWTSYGADRESDTGPICSCGGGHRRRDRSGSVTKYFSRV